MTPTTGILTTLLNAFIVVFSAGPGRLAPGAGRLLFLMAAIELTLAGLWWALKGENVLVGGDFTRGWRRSGPQRNRKRSAVVPHRGHDSPEGRTRTPWARAKPTPTTASTPA